MNSVGVRFEFCQKLDTFAEVSHDPCMQISGSTVPVTWKTRQLHHFEITVRSVFSLDKPVKADSHIPCRFPAMPSFPFDLHSAAVSDSHLPCHAHCMLRPCRSSQGHGTARPSRDDLCATCPSTVSGYHAEFHEGCNQKHTNLRCRWPVWNQKRLSGTRKGVVAAHYKKKLLKCWTSSSDIPATTRTFTKDTALSEHGRGTAWHGRGTACFNVPSSWYPFLLFSRAARRKVRSCKWGQLYIICY